MNIIIKVGSVTNAQRGLRVLRHSGIKAQLNRLENPSAGDGCGFVLKVNEYDKDKAISVLKRNGVRILGVKNDDIL